MATTIKLKNSVTTTNAPSSLVQGEVAINITDKKVWVGNAATTPIQLLGAGASMSFGALTCTSLTNSGLTSGRVTYASTGGLLTDSANMTFNGTTLTVADLTDSSLTANRVVYATTGGNLTSSANLTFNGTTLTTANDASISGLTVGKGGGVGSNNVLGSNGALSSNTSGFGNTAIGDYTLVLNTTGSFNIAVGSGGTMYFNTTGSNNTAVGQNALRSNTTASNNTAVGYQALYSNNNNTNVAVGYQAGYTCTNTAFNVFVGGFAGYSYNRTASSSGFNTIVGYRAGYSSTTGQHNTFIGSGSTDGAGAAITTGSLNTIIGGYNGNQGGLDIRTANNYIVLSDGDGNPRVYVDNNGVTYFGVAGSMFGRERISIYSTTGEGLTSRINDLTYAQMLLKSNTASSSTHNMIFFRNSADTTVGTITHNDSNTTYATSSDYRLKENIAPMTGALEKVLQLKPCTYVWKTTKKESQGFIAHELQEIIPDAVVGEKDALNEDGSIKPQGVDTSFLVATLTAAIQELKAEVNSLKAQLNK